MLHHGERRDRVVQKFGIVFQVLYDRSERLPRNVRRHVIDDENVVVGRYRTGNLEQVKVFEHLQ
jgi:hypothetical protein